MIGENPPRVLQSLLQMPLEPCVLQQTHCSHVGQVSQQHVPVIVQHAAHRRRLLPVARACAAGVCRRFLEPLLEAPREPQARGLSVVRWRRGPRLGPRAARRPLGFHAPRGSATRD